MTWTWILIAALATLLACTLATVWLSARIHCQWIVWRGLPRETRDERRSRRCRVAIHEAEDLLDGAYRHLALPRARRAYRLDPTNARALYVLGCAWGVRQRHELALKHYETAYRLIEHEYRATNKDQSAMIPELAVEAARVCARLRIETESELEREKWAEQVLEWAAIAVEHDPDEAACLMDDPLLRELRTQVRLMPSYAEKSWETSP